jgi:hypothetical protein
VVVRKQYGFHLSYVKRIQGRSNRAAAEVNQQRSMFIAYNAHIDNAMVNKQMIAQTREIGLHSFNVFLAFRVGVCDGESYCQIQADTHEQYSR